MSERDPRLELLRERRLQATAGKEKTRMATEYVVLFKNGNEGWESIDGKWKAPNGRQAITLALTKFNFDASASEEFVAVPARSWRPITVQQETKLKFS